MAQAHWKNLRVAETEKYAHVTYFFNGGNEKPYRGEEREMVASPKVATYDLKPEMSAAGITEKVVARHRARQFRRHRDELRQCRYGGAFREAGADHSGLRSSGCGARRDLQTSQSDADGSWLITADHGNAETMIDPVTKARTRITPRTPYRSSF